MRRAVLGIGSNLGDSAAILRGAVADLQAVDGITVTAVSAVYETDPVGGPEQGVFLNAVVLVSTTLGSRELLTATQSVEQSWHRVREVRWGPRTLDIDIIAIDDEVSSDPVLTLPHPLAHDRAFVLVPWLDADPEAELIGLGRVDALVSGVDTSGVRRTDIELVLA